MQLAVWPEISKNWVNIDRAPDRSARNQAFRIFEELDQITPKEIGAQTQREEIPSLRFAPEAQAIFGAFLEKLERRLRSGTLVDAPAFESYLSKYRSLMPSLALISHLIKRVDGSSGTAVSATAARLAERWCGFLEAHARKIYAPELNQELPRRVPCLIRSATVRSRMNNGALPRSCSRRGASLKRRERKSGLNETRCPTRRRLCVIR